jgi:hypothetical protein
MSDADPVFAAIERYEAACQVWDAAISKGGIGRDVIVATDTALRALVFWCPRLKKVRPPNETISHHTDEGLGVFIWC